MPIQRLKILHVAFLDIVGAFNNILPRIALTRLEVDDLIVSLINQLLKCSIVELILDTSTVTRPPKGGVSSTLLWNINVNELLRIIEEEGCSVFDTLAI